METAAILLFGSERPDGSVISEAEWAGFLQSEITPRFPDGFTVLAGRGEWRDTETGKIGGEPSHVVMIASEDSARTGANLDAVAQAYKQRFSQKSVGVLLTPACAAF